MNRPIFWVGFAFAIFPIAWNMIGYFQPVFPTIPRQFGLIQLGRDFPPISTRFYPLIIGASYFVELEVSGSIIAYFLLLTFQIGIFNRLGFETGPLVATPPNSRTGKDWVRFWFCSHTVSGSLVDIWATSSVKLSPTTHRSTTAASCFRIASPSTGSSSARSASPPGASPPA